MMQFGPCPLIIHRSSSLTILVVFNLFFCNAVRTIIFFIFLNFPFFHSPAEVRALQHGFQDLLKFDPNIPFQLFSNTFLFVFVIFNIDSYLEFLDHTLFLPISDTIWDVLFSSPSLSNFCPFENISSNSVSCLKPCQVILARVTSVTVDAFHLAQSCKLGL